MTTRAGSLQEYLATRAELGIGIVIGQLAFLVVTDDRDRYSVQIRVIAPGAWNQPALSDQAKAKRDADRRAKRKALVARADKRRRQAARLARATSCDQSAVTVGG